MASLDEIRWNEQGLVTVIAQDAHTGEVRMLAYANEQALQQTLDSGYAHFFSRSRKALWKKGEESGHTLAIREVWVDCDRDAVLYLVDPAGPTCHTGAETCFYTRLDATSSGTDTAAPTLLRLERTLRNRAASTADKSYTKSLLDAGSGRIGEKISEESGELVAALSDETEERVVSETGDVIYHVLVGLMFRRVRWRQILDALAGRFHQSGHDEKRNRG